MDEAFAAGQTSGAAMRTGAKYLDELRRRDRAVFVDGEIVRDVGNHPAFSAAARSIARLWDVAADPANSELMTFASPKTAQSVLRCYQIPATPADLARRRHMSTRWALESFGLMGRTPDHVAGFLTGYAAKLSVFSQAAGPEFASNILKFYERARDEHLFLSYAIVPPQIDRSKPAHAQSDPTLYAGTIEERDDGIVLRGAQQLATSAMFSDYIYVSCIHPLQPGDEAYAFGAVIPVDAHGLKMYTRRSYAAAATSSFDYPLSSRFDETDSLIVLDNVRVPWEHVFFHRNIALCRDQWFLTPAHCYGNHQAQARYAVKLRFLVGLTKRLCEIIGTDNLQSTQIQLGEMAAFATIVDAMIMAQEQRSTIDEEGVIWPSRADLYAVMSLQSEINPRLLGIARELAGAAMIMLPSAKGFTAPAMAADFERYFASPRFSARDRVAILKMAWDMIGTEFAGRHDQYERFYGGASFVNKQHMARAYDFGAALDMVDRALGLPETDDKR
jgi:4-hydroxyphenylacetate 3-monooxygenase